MTRRRAALPGLHAGLVAALLATLLAGCADALRAYGPRALNPAAGADIAPDEVVIVINGNAAGGSHAGLFAGGLLSDPAGSYVEKRSESPDWPGPSLADYLRFQREDGDQVRAYRFRLNAEDLAAITKRIREHGTTAPLFCAASVQNQIAGIGPFAGIEAVWWTSPSALARQLEGMLAARRLVGRCEGFAGAPC